MESGLRGMTWKSVHNDSLMSESKAVATAGMGREDKIECLVDEHAGSWWVPHHRTGIYYPIGQERVMEDVPIEAAKSAEVIHCFSSREDVHVLGGRE
ncbi:F-box/LRR-repeat-like protein [Cinnamomum micranthum f. kanehirae]|uniref:F-box/LRR-repeat-like protein n=1 Tax=Cinnamomum micranthum f. kanehirae TaxID=337451 RepID=A0A3S3P1W5_9MAGN|nr:F-box/LRR-repeat-like protein [Cinnamomum micranthum f. kanehirae]